MGILASANSKSEASASEPVIDRADGRAKPWVCRLQRYFERYKLVRSHEAVVSLAQRISADRSAWTALLIKYGPELDPPFDKPPLPATQELEEACFVDDDEGWFQLLSRYFAVYRADMSRSRIAAYARSIPRRDRRVAWQAIVERFGPAPSTAAPRGHAAEIEGALEGHPRVDREKHVLRMRFKLAALKSLRERGCTVSPQEIEAILSNADDDTTKAGLVIAEKLTASYTPIRVDGAIHRSEWAQLIAELDPSIDPFDVERLLDSYASRPEGWDGLFLHLAYNFMERTPSTDSSTVELGIARFWANRRAAYVKYFGEESSLRMYHEWVHSFANAANADERIAEAWSAALARFGPEPPELQERHKEHPEYWVYRIALLVHQQHPGRRISSCMRSARALLPAHGATRSDWESIFHEFDREDPWSKPTADDSQADVSDAEVSQEFLLATYREKLRQFYLVHDQAKASRQHIERLLEHASKHPGGLPRVWELLLKKYIVPGTEGGVTPPSAGENAAPKLPSAHGDRTVTASLVAHSPSAASVPKSNPTCDVAEREKKASSLSRHREYWRLRLHCMRLAAGIDVSPAALDEELDRIAGERKQYQHAYDSMSRRYQPWEPPAMSEEFWEWRSRRLAERIKAEFPLALLPSHVDIPSAAARYTVMRERFDNDGLTDEQAFEEYYREEEGQYLRARGWLKHTTHLGASAVGDRAFWVKKMHDACAAFSFNVTQRQIEDALDLGEVLDREYRDIFTDFVRHHSRTKA